MTICEVCEILINLLPKKISLKLLSGTQRHVSIIQLIFLPQITLQLNQPIQQMGFPSDVSGKEPTCQFRRHKNHRFNPWAWKVPWSRAWQPTLVFLPGESHRQRSLAGYDPQVHKELDMTKVTQHSTQHIWYISTLFTKLFSKYTPTIFSTFIRVPLLHDDIVKK